MGGATCTPPCAARRACSTMTQQLAASRHALQSTGTGMQGGPLRPGASCGAGGLPRCWAFGSKRG